MSHNADTMDMDPSTNELLAQASADNTSISGSLNLECYWEEAKRIEQELPEISQKRSTEYEETKDERDPDAFSESTEESRSGDLQPLTSMTLTLSEAVSVVKHVAMLSAMVRKRRLTLARSGLEDETNRETEGVSPLHVSPQPRDPQDNNYLVLQSGNAGYTDEAQPLPVFRLRFQPTGVSYMDDLAEADRDKIRHIALLELTAIFDRYNLPLRLPRTKRKLPVAESRVLGVPLTTLLERDQERVPSAKCPIFVEKICQFLDENALRDEGILRIPGNSARLKRLRKELETGYDDGTFEWEGRRTNDAATLLKQFLRELPIPLLTNEYLRAFATTEAITHRRDQIGAFNLLILLLPDVHRETLMVLLRQLKRITENEDGNKMGLSNVSMIIAPNLFCQLGKISRNADSEVKLAAGTSLVVRILIYYCHILFVVPNVLLGHLRDLTEAEASQTRKAKNFKDVKKVLTQQRKQAVSTSRLTELPSPVVGKVSKSNHYVMKILSPEFPRISMILEINNHSRVCEVLANFRRKQLGLISPTLANQTVDDSSSINALDLSFSNAKGGHKPPLLGSIGVSGMPPAATSSMEIDHLCVNSSSSSLQDAFTTRRHSSPCNPCGGGGGVGSCGKVGSEDLYECDGNIGSRRLREDALVMEILKENPGSSFYVKKRSPNVDDPNSGPLTIC